MGKDDDGLTLRIELSPKNKHRFRKLKGELECDTNDEAINEIVKRLNRRIEQDKRRGDDTLFHKG